MDANRPISFIFIEFWGENGQITAWHPQPFGVGVPPPREILDPPLRLNWIAMGMGTLMRVSMRSDKYRTMNKYL